MKIPAQPPDLSELQAELLNSPETVNRLFRNLPNVDNSGEYLSWDKVRFMTPPEGLTRPEWWLLLKWARLNARRPLPLEMADGRQFTYALPDSILRLTDEISRRASGQLAVSEQITNASTRDRYIVSSLIEESITSSQLEGAVTSRKVAKEMLRSGRPARNHSERMILNNYSAMRFVSALDNKTITPDLVCEIQRIVTEDALEDPTAAGRLQLNSEDRVAVFDQFGNVLHTPPPADQLQKRLKTLCRFANGSDDQSFIHPVLRALVVHFMVGYDHYFVDGNGRTARALFYLVMLREGYWLTEFLAISKILKNAPAKYGRSFILTEQDDGDLTYFLMYHLEVVRRAIDEFDDYLGRKVDELRETRILLAANPGEYNHRQLAILELALKDASARFTVLSHAGSHVISDETARQDLKGLTRQKLLVQGRESRRNVWRPSPDLADQIRRLKGQ